MLRPITGTSPKPYVSHRRPFPPLLGRLTEPETIQMRLM
jgi:hypothetical protein